MREISLEERKHATTEEEVLGRIVPCLVRPEGSGNIGSAARAAAVMGLGTLRLVQPHAPINLEARKMAAGAQEALRAARSCASLDEALHDAVFVLGFSARRREHRIQPVWLESAVPKALAAARKGTVVLLFGNERTGLENPELDRAHQVVRIPTSRVFSSLNLAQAVMTAAYEFRRHAGAEMEEYHYELAPAEDVERCIQALAAALDRRRFFAKAKRTLALRRLRDLFGRAVPYKNEISLLRGMIRSLDEDPPV
ncbi:MAG: TrmJ/YjtD family RNA methyltransferase [Candidatus Hydrogenedentota bacterium]|nr:MAG: TrmJ/YjtD family RNA methyltransferase [Candidatus Hydrogenedentota bacterium]